MVQRSFVAPAVLACEVTAVWFAMPSIAGFDFTPNIDISGPVNLPQAIVAKVAADVIEALKDPALIERLKVLGIDAFGAGPQEYAALLTADRARFEKVIKASGVKAE